MRFGLRLSMLALLLAAASLGRGATTYVDAARPDDSGDGLSWPTAKQMIQAAVDVTSATHEVWVRQGKYVESITMRSGVGLYGGFAGSETRREDRSTSAALTEIGSAYTGQDTKWR